MSALLVYACANIPVQFAACTGAVTADGVVVGLVLFFFQGGLIVCKVILGIVCSCTAETFGNNNFLEFSRNVPLMLERMALHFSMLLGVAGVVK